MTQSSALHIQPETPMEFFREQIERALTRQRVESSEHATYYLTQLLDDFVCPHERYARVGVDGSRPLAEIFCVAVASQGQRRYELLKLTGDLALFITGFLSESLNRALVSAGYYSCLGGQAYGAIDPTNRALAGLFAELAARFGEFADVLAEVSEQCALTDDRNLLRLYERWLETGSRRSAETLRQQGILVVPSSDEVH